MTRTAITATRKITTTVLIQNLHFFRRAVADNYIRPEELQITKEQPVPEYDPLADLYDLEYAHDYDLPFWLALAKREGDPIVEWGAGTGRLSVPLSTAGFDVTAVETSGAMI